MSRRNRTDSEKGVKEIFDGAGVILEPPIDIKLGDGVRPYWDLLVKCKATRAWQEQDLVLLVELARNLYRTEKLSFDMLTEDEIFIQENGMPKANPKSGIIDQLVKRARMIYAMLQIHPEATQGKSRDQVKQNKNHAQTSQSLNEDDGLLATPPQAH